MLGPITMAPRVDPMIGYLPCKHSHAKIGNRARVRVRAHTHAIIAFVSLEPTS